MWRFSWQHRQCQTNLWLHKLQCPSYALEDNWGDSFHWWGQGCTCLDHWVDNEMRWHQWFSTPSLWGRQMCHICPSVLQKHNINQVCIIYNKHINKVPLSEPLMTNYILAIKKWILVMFMEAQPTTHQPQRKKSSLLCDSNQSSSSPFRTYASPMSPVSKLAKRLSRLTEVKL